MYYSSYTWLSNALRLPSYNLLEQLLLEARKHQLKPRLLILVFLNSLLFPLSRNLVEQVLLVARKHWLPRSTLYIPALTLPFSSVFFDSFSITLLYSRRRGSWLWHSPVNTNTAVICVMGVSLNLTTPIKFSLTLINSDVHCFLCKVYNRVDSSNINSQPWFCSVFQIF